MLSSLSIGLVLFAAFLHAAWNALLRGGVDRAQSMLMMNWVAGCTGVAMLLVAGLPSLASAPYVVASGAIHVTYNALLVRMYRSGDLGETYPVARGTSPALIALGGSLFAGEWLGALGSLGIALVCCGILLLATAKGRLHAMNLPWALTTGVAIAAYSIVDGLGARVSGNWIGFNGASCAFFFAAPLWYWLRRDQTVVTMPPVQAIRAAAGGLISIVGYSAIVWAMQVSPLGAVSAMRETSVVFAALLGVVFLGEKLTMQRIAACLVIAAGAACIGWPS